VSDAEKVLSIRLCKAAVSFIDIRSDRNGRAIPLIDEEPVAARELFRVLANGIGKVDRFLVDE
jgi:hypothetical protein